MFTSLSGDVMLRMLAMTFTSLRPIPCPIRQSIQPYDIGKAADDKTSSNRQLKVTPELTKQEPYEQAAHPTVPTTIAKCDF